MIIPTLLVIMMVILIKIKVQIPLGIHIKILIYWATNFVIYYIFLVLIGEFLLTINSIRMIYFYKACFSGLFFNILGI